MPSQASIDAVAAVFQNVFGRTPTSQESSTWATQIDSGAMTAQLASVLAASPEGAANISALYQQILGRGLNSVSSSEIASGEAYLAQDKANGLAGLRTSIASSAEAQADIKAVYQSVLGRTASSGEITSAETALANGATLAQLYTSATASPELTTNLTAAYRAAFGTAPSTTVVTYLHQQIVKGAVFSQLATALTSLAAGSSGPSIPDTFNPAESMVASASAGASASTAATASAAASGASLVQLTNPATAGITPALHS